MSSSEHLENIRSGLRESVDFFASRDSFLRERWVAESFLLNLGVAHESLELVRGGDPPDVVFRDARIEVKEIMDSNRRRVPEFREALSAALAATDAAELLEGYTPKNTSVCELFEIVLGRATELSSCKYPLDVRREMDLLFYVNLQDVMGLVEVPYPNVEPLAALGFRSVSFLDGHRSCVFCAALNAPAFLQEHLGVNHRAPIDEAT